MRKLLFLFLLFPFTITAQAPLQPVGAWQEYLPYHSALDVTASDNKIFCATPYSFFSVDVATKEIVRYSKISGLSETGISTMALEPVNNKLIVAYTSSNIDVLTQGSIKNIPDLKRKSIAGDKTVYHIFTNDDLAYLSTGFGIVVIDLQKYEIKDTWVIGAGGAYTKVNRFTKDNNYYYAATEEGLKRIPVNSPNPADYNLWQTEVVSGSTPAACKGVANVQNKIIAWQDDRLFAYNGTSWTPFFENGWPIVSINESGNQLAVCQRQSNGDSKVVFLNADGNIAKTLDTHPVISFPKKALVHTSGEWVADLYGGLSHWSGNSYEQFQLNSPQDIATGEMLVHNNSLYAAAGAVDEAWNAQKNSNGVYQYKNGAWTNINRYQFPQLDTLQDFITVAVDPSDETVWAGSYGGGLLHVTGNNGFQIYKQSSPIAPVPGDPTSYRVSGLAFDADNNLWIANYGAERNVHVLKKDGSWQSFISPFTLSENAVAQIIIDDTGQKWIVSPKGGGLLCFNSGISIDNTGDDRWVPYKSGSGSGNLPSSNVLSIAKDKSGFIWVGTADGMAAIQCPELATTTGCPAYWPVIKQGAFANYLFKGEEVRCIAVDDADRKWVATKNGAWMVSAEGDKVLAHFTEDDSPLLSNDIRKLAINSATGEVFFGTAKGICSYRAGGTSGSLNSDNLLVFPNPVPPGYGGTITIQGLAENSFVKITELNGRLAFQTKAQGGKAEWDGRDYRGNKIATGVYLVLVRDETNTEKAVGKIVFIRK